MKKRGLSSIRPVPACLSTFLRVSSKTIEIVKSKQIPYDGWIIQSNGRLIACNFVWLLSIVHLLVCKHCRERMGLDEREVKREFRRLLKHIKEESEMFYVPPFLRHLKS